VKKTILILIFQLPFLTVIFFSCTVVKTNIKRIDTHIHLYDTRRDGSAVFLDSVVRKKIYYPHFTEDFIKVAHPAGVKYAVVIEASFRREDNFWLANLVKTSKTIKAFIANLDPRDPHFVDDLDSLLHYKKFRGIRIRTKTEIDLSIPEIIKTLGELHKRNLILEVNTYDPGIIKIAQKYPKMTIIMDHLAGGHIEKGIVLPTNWREQLDDLAAEQNIYIKISALYTLSGQNPAPTNPSFYKLLIDPVIDIFGPQRVMFGSNWTLSELRGTYSDMIKMLDAYLEKRSDINPEQFYYKNAIKAYKL
jgi:L-fuconolactonase